MDVLEVEALTKTFVRGFFRRRTRALAGISFRVEQGEVFGFLGPNGAGKTTTIKILMGLVFPTSGTARVLGAPIGDRAVKQRVGYLAENPYFYDYLSVQELLDMVGRLHGQDGAQRRRRAGELIERVGLAHAGRRPLRSFSKGMLQRAGLAQALMGDPDLVVLDEPMSGLDPIGRKEVRDIVVDLRSRGKTVFFSTHILSDASTLCDRVAILVGGTLRDVGPLGKLLDPRVESIELVWTAPTDRLSRLRERAGEHATTSEGEVTRVRDLDEANAMVAAVVEAGGTVLQMTQHRQSLEELFVNEASRAGGAEAGA